MSNLWNMAVSLAGGIWRKTSAWQRSARLTDLRTPLSPKPDEVHEIGLVLKRRESGISDIRNRYADPRVEQETVSRILKETEVWNLNNVTRTQAYWNLYCDCPELHWSLLAHLVSRNGGWSMTDLKGEWLPHLINPQSAQDHFQMLETCNAMIFRDAYPQLKLYSRSRRIHSPLFHLLPRFGVSAFMEPFWTRFWQKRQSELLTVALIINEQHVIEHPVVQNERFRSRVLESLTFRSLPLMQTNQIVFPLFPEGAHDGFLPLAGRVLENFQSLEERIEFGKSLYAMLFGYPRVLAGAHAFASRVPHTGSRSDYWPARFSPSKNKTGRSPPDEKMAGERWYSPPLEAAWPDRPLPADGKEDWYRDQSVLSYLGPLQPPRIIDITFEHLFAMRKWQAAAALSGPD